MEKETSSSKRELMEKLRAKAELIRKDYGIQIFFAEILGKRWSYLAGEGAGFKSFLSSRIQLNERLGMISEGWEKISGEERKNIVSSFLHIIEQYEQE